MSRVNRVLITHNRFKWIILDRLVHRDTSTEIKPLIRLEIRSKVSPDRGNRERARGSREVETETLVGRLEVGCGGWVDDSVLDVEGVDAVWQMVNPPRRYGELDSSSYISPPFLSPRLSKPALSFHFLRSMASFVPLMP